MALMFFLALGLSWIANHREQAAAGMGKGSASPTPSLAQSLDQEPYQDALVLASFTVPALVLIWLVSLWSLRPVARASAEARALRPGDHATRLSLTGMPAEIVPLVDAMNGALGRMADAVAAERRFTENAAHELRTPLAVLAVRLQRAKLDPLLPPDWRSIDRDVAHLTRLVGQLLDLARKENALHDPATLPIINLARIAREAAATLLPLVEAQGRVLAIDLPDTLKLNGDAGDLRDALRNLLENAALHGAGRITVQAPPAIAAGKIQLTISDEGPGIQSGAEETMFERFRKGGSSDGSGLGLAIVREVIGRHHGTVRFLPGAPCRVRVEF